MDGKRKKKIKTKDKRQEGIEKTKSIKCKLNQYLKKPVEGHFIVLPIPRVTQNLDTPTHTNSVFEFLLR
jgi:hypothetical protein